jgi:hypothetical protein
MQNMTSYRDFSHYQTLQNKVNIPNGILSLVRSKPILSKPYSTKTSSASKVSILTLDLETRALANGQLAIGSNQ